MSLFLGTWRAEQGFLPVECGSKLQTKHLSGRTTASQQSQASLLRNLQKPELLCLRQHWAAAAILALLANGCCRAVSIPVKACKISNAERSWKRPGDRETLYNVSANTVWGRIQLGAYTSRTKLTDCLSRLLVRLRISSWIS